MTNRSEYEEVYRQLFSAGWGAFVEEIGKEPLRYNDISNVEDHQSFTGRLPYDTALFNNGDPFAAIANMASHTRNKVNNALVEALGAGTMPKPDKKSYKLVYGSRTGPDSATIWDLGGGTGSKLVKEYTDAKLAKEGRNSYTGPRATIFDKIEDPTNGNTTVWGVNYKHWDAEIDPFPVPPLDTLLTSVNFATNVSKKILEELQKYDGVHLVPNCKTMVAMGVSKRKGDMIETTIGGQLHVEFYHDLILDPESGHKTTGFYGHLYCFSQREIFVDADSVIRSTVNEQSFPTGLCEKPDRYATTNNGFYGPYKLKYDGNECLIRMSSTSVTVQTRTMMWEYQAGAGNVCNTEIHLFGEMVCELVKFVDDFGEEDVDIKTQFYPHLVYQAGRRVGENGLKTFLSKTNFNIPEITVIKNIQKFDSIQDALVASYESSKSDGIIALGGPKHVAAKLYETVDIRACSSKTLHTLSLRVFPRSLVIASAKNPLDTCKGQKGCDTCPIFEYAIRFNGSMVILNQVGAGPRRDKLSPNALERVVRMLPDGKTGKDPNTIWDELGDGVVVQLKNRELSDNMPGRKFFLVNNKEGAARLSPIASIDEATEIQELDDMATECLVKKLAK